MKGDTARAGSAESSGKASLHGSRGLATSFLNAGRGLLRTVSTQRNMKIHTVAAVMVMIVGMALPFELASRTALLFCVALVYFAEILNTALESFVDLHVEGFDRRAMLAKDAAAAGVLVLAVATVVILAAIIHFEWAVVISSPEPILRSVGLGLPLTVCTALLLWRARSTAYRVLLVTAAGLLAIPLITRAADPVFSACLVSLLVLAAAARPADHRR